MNDDLQQQQRIELSVKALRHTIMFGLIGGRDATQGSIRWVCCCGTLSLIVCALLGSALPKVAGTPRRVDHNIASAID